MGNVFSACSEVVPGPGEVQKVPDASGGVPASSGLNAEDENGKTALMRAVMDGTLADMKALLAQGADPNHETADGVTALMNAAYRNKSEMVQALVAGGANIDHMAEIKSLCPRTALMKMAWSGSTDGVRLLIANRATVDCQSPEPHCETALKIAAESGHVEIVKMLVGAGASSLLRPVGGRTAKEIANQVQGNKEINHDDPAPWKEIVAILEVQEKEERRRQTEAKSSSP